MTTTPDNGLEAIGDLLKDAVAYVALGAGQNESTTATSLGDRQYTAQVSNSNVEVVETGVTGEYEVVIRVKGGTEVSGGTEISEMAIYDGDPGGGGVLLQIDEFPSVEVEAGHTEEFTIPVDPRRA